MQFKKRNLDPRIFFKRRPLRLEPNDGLSHGSGTKGKKALFSFPIIIFIASLILSPVIFISIIVGERALYGFVSGISIAGIFGRKDDSGKEKIEECLYLHPLDLTCLAHPWNRKKIAAVSIDNMVDARPQSGIADARLVIEAPVEAGITRLLAFYGDGDEVPEIGPVRSARPYFIDFAKEYKASLVHVGGSAEALKILKDERYPELDEMISGASFWRDSRREAPHSTFTSTDNLFSALSRLSDVEPLPLLKGSEPTKEAMRLRIAAPSSSYEVQWKYDKENNRYDRLQAGAAHRDSKGRAIFASNVLVLRMPIEVIDDVGRRSMDSLGAGEALIFRNGEVIKGTWKKESLGDRMRFFGSEGEESAFFKTGSVPRAVGHQLREIGVLPV